MHSSVTCNYGKCVYLPNCAVCPMVCSHKKKEVGFLVCKLMFCVVLGCIRQLRVIMVNVFIYQIVLCAQWSVVTRKRKLAF